MFCILALSSLKTMHNLAGVMKQKEETNMTLGRMLTVLVRPHKLRYDARRPLSKTKKIKAVLTGTFSVLVAGLLFTGVQLAALTISSHNVVYAAAHDSLADIATAPTGKVVLTSANLDASALQKVVDNWQVQTKGSGSVVILDAQTNQKLASTGENKEYFTASIYKLYVAYLALQDIDSGIHTINDPFLDGQTRAQCLDNMIQNSDSNCGEKMLNEFPRDVLQQRLNQIGLKNTSLIKYTTTAADAALVTQKVAIGDGLSKASTELMHTAMQFQKYQQGLQTGFNNLTVYDKIGFYETGWHDSAFVKLPSGKLVVVTVLTQDMGSKQVNNLAKKLQPLFMGN